MNEQYYVMVGNQLFMDYQKDVSGPNFTSVEFTLNPELAISYESLKRAREHATRLRYMFESTNARVVKKKKVVKTVFEDVEEL